MSGRPETLDAEQQLTDAWPTERWRDVHVLAAVSGGPDSVALVRALGAAKRTAGGAGRVLVGHVNHGWRGAESDEDEEWVRNESERWGMECVVRRAADRATTPARDATAEGGLPKGSEDTARELRYRMLTEMAEEAGARFVATGHTRDDQAETVLFRLLRGSGLQGLAGMRRVRPLSASVTLVRPLLGCTRAVLERYLEQIGQAWRTDATNGDRSFARNRIRGELLPYLREHFNPDADAALLRAAEMAGEGQELIDSLAAELFEACRVGDAGPAGVTLRIEPLATTPELLVAETLRRTWRAAGWPEQAMTRRWWLALVALARSAAGGPAINLPGNVLARREGTLLVLSPGCGLRLAPPGGR